MQKQKMQKTGPTVYKYVYTIHFDFTILYFVVKMKQIRAICSEDLPTSLLSSVLFAVELRFV